MCMWEEWLSKTSKTVCEWEAFVCFWKCIRKIMKVSSCIQPDGFPAPIEPTGPSLRKWSWYRTRGNTNIGGIGFPKAFAAKARVTKVSRSAEVREPTCRAPRLATTLPGSVRLSPLSRQHYILASRMWDSLALSVTRLWWFMAVGENARRLIEIFENLRLFVWNTVM